MRNIVFGTGEYYHVYNRGVDKRETFISDEDRQRFLAFLGRSKHESKTGRHLVNLHAYALMTNHFHFLVEQTSDDGVAQFMQRLSTSYTRSFNRKYQRSGSLFEATYKAKHIDSDAYLAIVAAYIHRNPLATDGVNCVEDLDNYEWSSYRHYRGITQDIVLDDGTLKGLFGSPESTKKFHMKDIEDLVPDEA